MGSDDIPKFQIRSGDRDESLMKLGSLFDLYKFTLQTQGFKLTLWEEKGHAQLILFDTSYIESEIDITRLKAGDTVVAPAITLHTFPFGCEEMRHKFKRRL